jgi:hypothetical protein
MDFTALRGSDLIIRLILRCDKNRITRLSQAEEEGEQQWKGVRGYEVERASSISHT